MHCLTFSDLGLGFFQMITRLYTWTSHAYWWASKFEEKPENHKGGYRDKKLPNVDWIVRQKLSANKSVFAYHEMEWDF